MNFLFFSTVKTWMNRKLKLSLEEKNTKIFSLLIEHNVFPEFKKILGRSKTLPDTIARLKSYKTLDACFLARTL